MAEAEHIERRLAAILSADVHGYSRRMAADEAATVTDIKRCREIIDAHVREHHGRIVDAPGDNVLAEFPSAVEAVQCAVEVQRELADRNSDLEPAHRMEFRIGIHVGDVILDDGKIYGDGVNIAARLEALATPGGICISREVHDQIRGKLDIDCEDIGEQQVKNIPRPVRVLRVRMGAAPMTPATRPRSRRVVIGSIASLCVLAAIAGAYFFIVRNPRPTSVTLPAAEPSRATVAVLPFANLSASKDDEYFSDGITDEIRGNLSKIAGLQVTARSSSFAFKGQNEDVNKIGGLLHVRNLLEGSVRRSADRIRVEVELIDATNGFTVWSDSYDKQMTDVFQIQSDVAESVADNLKVKLFGDEKARVESKPTQNLEAYNLYLLGNYHMQQFTTDSFTKAADSYRSAVEKDPKFALAYAYLAYAYELAGDETMPQRESTAKAKVAAERALALDDKLGSAHGAMGIAHMNDWDWAEAERQLKLALTLDPGSPDLHETYAEYLIIMGRYSEALRERERSRERSPISPLATAFIGDVYLYSRQYNRALQYYQAAIQMAPDFSASYRSRGLLLLSQGKPEAAVPDFEKAFALDDSPLNQGLLGQIYGLTRRRAEALKILEQLKQRSTSQYVTAIAFVAVYQGLGDKDRAFQWLEKAYEDRSGFLPGLRAPFWDDLRSDPRFQAIYNKMGLPN